MPYVAVAIVSWISHDQPGFVVAELMDAYGTVHTFHDKLPVFGSDIIDENTVLPIPGMLGCEVRERFYEGSRYLARIDTERPWDIPSTNGEYHFVVPANAVMEYR